MHNKLQANLLKEAALKNIDSFQLTPNPDNYRLWFEYATSTMEALNGILDSHIAERKTVTDKLCRELYTRFIATRDQQDVDEARIAFGEMLGVMIQHIQSWGSSTDQFCDTLNACATRLDENPDVTELRQIIQEITVEARKALTQSRDIKTILGSLSDEIATLRKDVDKLGNEALTDSLTQTANRRGFDSTFSNLASSASEEEKPLSLLVLDIDNFKTINDSFGHQVGDKILKYLATTLRNAIRGNDFLARYGGEEFTILLTDTSIDAAEIVANKLLQQISARQLTTGTNQQVIGRITASIGIAGYRYGESLQSLFKRADQAMYTAKRQGKNRAVRET